MPKQCILINGTMGVGKTTVCKELASILPRSVFLDGDWCWYSNPLIVTEDSKKMVLQNIGFLLRSFLNCPDYQTVIFCWVMDRQEILDQIIELISPACQNTEIRCFTLTVSEPVLLTRLQKDVDLQLHQPDILSRSVARLGLYHSLNTEKINTDRLSPQQTAQKIIERL